MKSEALRFEGVSVEDFRYGGLINATFCLYQGETIALAGLLRSGKKSLISVLAGELSNYEGKTFLFGKEQRLSSDTVVNDFGIASIGDNPFLFDNLSVFDNICLPKGDKKLFSVMDYVIDDPLTKWLFNEINPEVFKKDIISISKFEITKLELLKVIYGGARIIIFSSAFMYLNEQETKELSRIIRHLNGFGVSVIFESDNDVILYEEIIERIMVIRNGMISTTVYKNRDGHFDKNIIRHIIAGHAYNQADNGKRIINKKNEYEYAKIYNLSSERTMVFSKGSVIGIFDPDEKLPKTLGELIKQFNDENVLYIGGKKISIKNVSDLVKNRISIITKEFADDLIFYNLSPVDNVCLHANRIFGKKFIYNKRTAKYLYNKVINKYDNLRHCIGLENRSHCYNLSYEQQYELMVAKWLAINPEFLIIYAPLSNHDIKNAEIYRKLQLTLSREGKILIIIASNIDYLEEICEEIIDI